MTPDPIDRLLARGRLDGRARERILEGALRDGGITSVPWYSRKLVVWGSPALACAAAVALVIGLREPSDSMRAKGSGTGVAISVECGGAEPSHCARGDKILFRVEGVPRAVYLAAFARLEGGRERIWFFPTADGSEPLLSPQDAPQVLREGVKADSLAPGRYEVQVVLATRPLSKGEIVAPPGQEVVAHRSTRLEVLP